MNKVRRKKISSLIDELAAIAESVEILMDEEQEYFDNMPDGIQASEKGGVASEAIDHLDTAKDEIESALDSLQGSIEL